METCASDRRFVGYLLSKGAFFYSIRASCSDTAVKRSFGTVLERSHTSENFNYRGS